MHLLGFVQPVCAQQTIVVKDAQKLLHVGNKIEVLADKSGKLTLQDVLTAEVQKRFKPHKRLVFSQAPSHTAYWLRFKVKNETNRDIWFALGDTRSWYLDFFAPNPSGAYADPVLLGVMRPQPTGALLGKYYTVPLKSASSDPNVYYVRIAGEFAITHLFQIGTTTAITRQFGIYNAILAGFIGLIVAMGVYNLFLFFATKDKIYLIYVGYLVIVFFSTPFNNGQTLFFGQWFWSYFTVWQSLLFWLVTLFVDRYLDLATNAVNVRRWLWLLTSVLGGVFPLLNLSGISLVYLISPLQLITLVYTFSLLVCGFYLLYKGVHTARFYTLGWSSVVISSFVYMMARNGILPLNVFTTQVLYFGFGAEALLFSLALGDRLNSLKKEKEKIQAQNLRLMTRQKDDLESMVQQRTQDIESMHQRLSLATKSASIGIWEYNYNTQRMTWDEQMYLLYGDIEKSFGGSIKEWLYYIRPQDITLLKAAFKQLKKRHKVSNVDFRIVTPQNEERWVCLSAILQRNENADLKNITGTIHDITSIKNANERLKENNLLLDSINYIQKEFIASENPETVFDFLLHQLLDITGSKQGLVGEVKQKEAQKPHFTAFAATSIGLSDQAKAQIDALKCADLLLNQVLSDGTPLIINDLTAATTQLVQTEDCTLIHSFLGIPLFMHDQLIGLVVVTNCESGYSQQTLQKLDPLLSTTSRLLSAYRKEQERLALMKALQKTTLEAQQASVAKSEFLANMSHEIRTPLNGVVGFVDLLLQTNLDATQKQYLDIVSQSGNTLLEIINDILDFSKIEAGKMELLPVKVDLAQMCDGLRDLMIYQTKQKGLEMILSLAGDLPQYAWFDEMRLKQVLTNLLSNAVKFTSKGTIEFKVTMLQKESNQKALLRFLVKDTGVGILPENQQKIFEAFLQEDTSTTKRFGGTGLGLSISNRLLALMDSRLCLESTHGKGSTFYFDIWVNCVFEEHNDWSRLDAIKQVLVIHHHPVQSARIEAILKEKGIQVTQAMHGISGIELLQANPYFQAVFIAEEMPFMDGMQTAQEIRQTLGLSNLPLVLLNSSNSGSSQAEGLALYQQWIGTTPQPSQLYKVLSKITEGLAETASTNEPKKDQAGSVLQKVLIVEDNEVNMLLMNEIIAKLLPSAKILMAHSGEEALAIYQTALPETILMDVQMPGMNGYETTRQIRKIEQTLGQQRSKIVAVTAGALKEEKALCIEAGMDEFVTKPINKSDIQHIFTDQA